MRVNFSAYEGAVTQIAITAPGDQPYECPCGCGNTIPGELPWACRRRGDRPNCRHSSCKVDDEAADFWCATMTARWVKLREAARLACKRRGFEPRILARVWEPQKRGVPHLHLVLGAEGRDHVAARVFAEELHRLSPSHGFGFVDRKVKPISHRDAANDLVWYLTGRTQKKSTIRDNIRHPRMPLSIIWVSRTLTDVTGCTMRRLRYVRWYMAALKGRAGLSIYPALKGQLLVDVARLVALIERRTGNADADDDHGDLELAARGHARNLRAMRAFTPWWAWTGYPEPRPATPAAA